MRYALGEFGGFTLHVGGALLSDPGRREADLLAQGDGSRARRPRRDACTAAGRSRGSAASCGPRPQAAAVHVTPSCARWSRHRGGAAAAPGGGHALAVEAAPDRPGTAPARPRAAQFEPMLRNTVNATIVRGGAKINVVPSEIELELDGRRYQASARAADRRASRLAGDDIELEVVRHDPSPRQPDLGLFETLAGVIRELDPEGDPGAAAPDRRHRRAVLLADRVRPTASCRCGCRRASTS